MKFPHEKWPWIVALCCKALMLPAQDMMVLHTFSSDTSTNLDGAGPEVGLVVSGDTLYGAAGGGANGSGPNNFGTVFSLDNRGSNFTVLHTFAGVTLSSISPVVRVNADGYLPAGTLILAGDMLYGAASAGGTNGNGTLFAVSLDGTIFTVLHTFATNASGGALAFTNSDGATPNSLVLAGDTLYGTASDGGTSGYGTIFAINTNGSGFNVLHAFTPADGKNPQSILVVDGQNLYGATPIGGANGAGTIYSLATSGTNFQVIHSFANNGATGQGAYLTGLLLSGGTLFGTDTLGGTNDTGEVFSLNTNGGHFTVIYTFGPLGGTGGAKPEGALELLGDTLYGAANEGGANDNGTLYCVSTNGATFNTLYSFSKLRAATNLDGAHPESGLVLSGTSLYGTAYFGGNGNGTVFALPVAPTLTGIGLLGTNLSLSGIDGLAGHPCAVLTSTNVALPPNQWTPVATNLLPGGANFSFVATNAVDPEAAQQFYLLQVQ